MANEVLIASVVVILVIGGYLLAKNKDTSKKGRFKYTGDGYLGKGDHPIIPPRTDPWFSQPINGPGARAGSYDPVLDAFNQAQAAKQRAFLSGYSGNPFPQPLPDNTPYVDYTGGTWSNRLGEGFTSRNVAVQIWVLREPDGTPCGRLDNFYVVTADQKGGLKGLLYGPSKPGPADYLTIIPIPTTTPVNEAGLHKTVRINVGLLTMPDATATLNDKGGYSFTWYRDYELNPLASWPASCIPAEWRSALP